MSLFNRFRERYIEVACSDGEVQRVLSVQMLCGSSSWSWLSKYFAFWTHLGSGPFYILGLCFFAWTGHPVFASYMCISLSIALYLTDIIKDYLALPRPPSPPCARGGTSSHALEYGFPSTHTACACVLAHLIARLVLEEYPTLWWGPAHHWTSGDGVYHNFPPEPAVYWGVLFIAGVFVWHVAFSRMYLGLHWLGDIVGGIAVYALWAVLDVYELRSLVTYLLRHIPLDSYFVWTLPLLFGMWAIQLHTTPRDACPCFEDSVRFVGADVGLVLGGWLAVWYHWKVEGVVAVAEGVAAATVQHKATPGAGVTTSVVHATTAVGGGDAASVARGDDANPAVLAGLSPLVFCCMYVIGIVLLIGSQEVAVKLLPKVLKPVLRFVSGGYLNKLASTSSSSPSPPPIIANAYKVMCAIVGAVFFLRRPQFFASSSSSLMTASNTSGGKHEDGGHGGGSSPPPSAVVSTGDDVTSSSSSSTTIVNTAGDEPRPGDDGNSSRKSPLTIATTPTTPEGKNVAMNGGDDDGGGARDDVTPPSSPSSGHHLHHFNGFLWSTKCHTHWEEDAIQAKFLSYVLLGINAFFIFPQFLYPGIIRTWEEITTGRVDWK